MPNNYYKTCWICIYFLYNHRTFNNCFYGVGYYFIQFKEKGFDIVFFYYGIDRFCFLISITVCFNFIFYGTI